MLCIDNGDIYTEHLVLIHIVFLCWPQMWKHAGFCKGCSLFGVGNSCMVLQPGRMVDSTVLYVDANVQY